MNAFGKLFRVGAPVALVLLPSFAGCSGNAAPSVAEQTVTCSVSHPFAIGVFGDPFHTHPQCQFNVTTSSAAYVYVGDVAASDRYVMYVRSSSRIPRVGGVQAPGGNVSFTWPLDRSLEPGLYTIAVYDQTAHELLGTVHVSLTSE